VLQGLLFADPSITTDAAFTTFLQNTFPFLTSTQISYLTSALYPPPSNTSLYSTQLARVSLAISDGSGLTCATNYLARAFGNDAYSYDFTIPPALHGEDVAYVYYNGPSAAVANATVAEVLQSYVVNFALRGQPNAEGLPPFEPYRADGQALALGLAQIETVRDPTVNKLCAFWQDKATYGDAM
jgi:carboxylesterase type B